MLPISYTPCETCPVYIVTDVNQPITSQAINRGIATRYIAPWFDWNFHRTRTVTVVVDDPHTLSSQIQTWVANTPYRSADPVRKNNAIIYTYCYEHIIKYVVQEPNYAFDYPMTVTITSTTTSTFTSSIGTDRATTQDSSLGSVTSQNPSQVDGLRPGAGLTMTVVSSDHDFQSGSNSGFSVDSDTAASTSPLSNGHLPGYSPQSGMNTDSVALTSGLPTNNPSGSFPYSAINTDGSVLISTFSTSKVSNALTHSRRSSSDSRDGAGVTSGGRPGNGFPSNTASAARSPTSLLPSLTDQSSTFTVSLSTLPLILLHRSPSHPQTSTRRL